MSRCEALFCLAVSHFAQAQERSTTRPVLDIFILPRLTDFSTVGPPITTKSPRMARIGRLITKKRKIANFSEI